MGEPKGRFFESDETARAGARRILITALDAEAGDYVERHRHEREDEGRALMLHNGRAQDTQATLGAGTMVPRTPRVNDCP
jgi:putative transposase